MCQSAGVLPVLQRKKVPKDMALLALCGLGVQSYFGLGVASSSCYVEKDIE